MDMYYGPVPFGNTNNMAGPQQAQSYYNYQSNTGQYQSGYPQYNVPQNSIGGFYGNNNRGWYNPYEYIRQQDERLKARASLCEEQISFRKTILRSSAIDAGYSVNEEALDKMFDPMRPKYKSYDDLYRDQSQQNYNEQDNVARILNLRESNPRPIYGDGYYREIEKCKQRFKGKSFVECCEELSQMSYELEQKEAKKRNKNLKNTYNQSAYQQLVSKISDNKATSIFGNTNIDDCEIVLPSSMTSAVHKRRMEFMQQVLSGK